MVKMIQKAILTSLEDCRARKIRMMAYSISMPYWTLRVLKKSRVGEKAMVMRGRRDFLRSNTRQTRDIVASPRWRSLAVAKLKPKR
jgi:hypothetical protein